MIPLQSSLFTKDALAKYVYIYVCFVGRGARGGGGGD